MRPKFTIILMIFLIIFISFILLSTIIDKNLCPLVSPLGENNAPQVNSTYPANGAIDISIDGIPINAYIYDFENDSLWTEIWSNHTGLWVQYAGYNLGVTDYENTSFIVDCDNDQHWDLVDYLNYHDNFGWVENGQYGFWGNNSVTNSWGMNQSATTYYWSINTTDNVTWTNQTFHFSTFDNPPSITNESPYDGAIEVELNPTIGANISDADENMLNVTFWTNATGSWELIGYNASVNNGTYSQTTSNMNNYYTKYWWSVNCTDGIKWTNDTYNFTTILADVLVDDDEVPGWYDATHVLTIQEAIDNASVDNRIYVYNGTYYENTIVNKTINLIGEDKNTTIIDGGYNGDVVSVYDNWVNITGFTIQNSNNSASGVKLNSSVEYCQITNNNINNNSCGIVLQNSNNNYITNNLINNNILAINLSNSSNNYINNNSMIKNSIRIHGPYLDNWNSHTIIDNTLNNKPIYYWKNKTNDIIPTGASQIILANCTNITIQNQNLSNGSIGILLGFSNYSTIINNTISNNSMYGIYLSTNSNYNTLYHNNFIKNNKSSHDQYDNTWYNSTLHQGNYWDDYTGIDSDDDGIGDTPYNILEGSNQDLYPLTGAGLWGQIPHQATLIFPSDTATGVTTSPILKVTVSDPNNDTMNVTFYSSPSNTIIGTVTNVTNNGNASITWSGLTYYTSYSWYVVVNDSNYLTKSETWTFKTKTRNTGGSGGGGGGGYIPPSDTGEDETNSPTAVPKVQYNALTYQPIIFDGSSSTDDGTIIEYRWTFGDSSTGMGIKPTHTYNKSGLFTVTLTVTDDTNLTDTKNTTINIILDTDSDGWSDEDEEYYGSDKTNNSDIPQDTDKDGVLDPDDEDDDNDIVNDEIEIILGTNPKIKDITIKIFNGIVFYLIETDGDDKPDRFYNTSSQKDATVKIRNDGTYLLNIDGDAYWDYVYDPASGAATNYENKSDSSDGLPWFTIASIIIIVIIAILVILYLMGYIWIGEE